MTQSITIITVNFNNASGLQKTMKSVLEQTYQSIQYVVIDGASTDDSVQVIKGFEHHQNLQWISEPDSGIYNAMNKGIRQASGNYLLFINSGDVLEKSDVIEHTVGQIQNNSAFVGCDLLLDTDEGLVKKSHPEEIRFGYLISRTIFHPSTFIRRDLFDTYGLYNESNKIVSDWEFFFKTIGLHGESFQKIGYTLTRFDMTGISSNPENKQQIKDEKDRVISNHVSSMKNNAFDAFLFEQYKSPNKRVTYLAKIEKSPFLRKCATVLLRILSFFNK